MTTTTLYLDLETVPDLTRDHLLPRDEIPVCETEPEDVPTMTLEKAKPRIATMPLELLIATEAVELAAKSRKGVLDEIATHRRRIENADEDRRKTQSLTPELCKIAAFGWAQGYDPAESVVCRNSFDEIDALSCFWRMVAATPRPSVCGFNITGFDLPVIFARSILLGVRPTRRFDMRPWGTDLVDLMLARAGRGSFKGLGLKALAAWYGIEVPAEGVDGSQVFGLYQSDPDKLAAYVESDVIVTRELHLLFGGTFC